MRKVILTVAPVSADASHLDPDATARDILASAAMGASIVHLHVRDENVKLTDDLTVLKKIVETVSAESEMIIQVSTGGVSGMTIQQRCAPLSYEKVEMSSLNVGSVNLGDAVYANPIQDVRYCVGQLAAHDILPEVEVFELGMIHTMLELSRDAALRKPLLFNLILGVKGAAPATVEALVALRSFIPRDALWGITHYGRGNMELLTAGVLMGASLVRVGFEDSDRLDDETKAGGNAEIVGRLAHILRTCGLGIATPGEAREILRLGR